MILYIFEILLRIVLEVKKYGLSCASCPCSRLYNFYWAFPRLLPHIPLFSLLNIVANWHAIIGLKHFRWSKPCVFRVSFEKLLLVVVKSHQRFEVDCGSELSNLKIWIRWLKPFRQKYPPAGLYKRSNIKLRRGTNLFIFWPQFRI